MLILKVDARKVHIKFQLIRLFYLFIWWCETTERFIDSHFDVKVSNVFFRCYGFDYINTPWSCASTDMHSEKKKFSKKSFLPTYPNFFQAVT